MMRNTLKAGMALLIAGAAMSAALALGPFSSTSLPVREHSTTQTNYFRFTLNYNDPGASSGIKFGRIGRRAHIHALQCHVEAAFNAVTTNVITMGVSATGTELIDAATSTKSIDESQTTVQSITKTDVLGVGVTSDDDKDLYVRYTQTGTAATAGKVTCVLSYMPNNDN